MFLHSYLPVCFYIFILLYCIRSSQWSPHGFLHRFCDPRYFAAVYAAVGLENQIYHPFSKPRQAPALFPVQTRAKGDSLPEPPRPSAPGGAAASPPAPSRRRRGQPGTGQPGGFPGSGGFRGRPRRGVQARAMPGAQ
ncbi:unnamed protein product, partial [Coccothraustes coccothraustes]